MDEIIVEGVRCFYERQSIPLRKLTVLVGENSSGKSTFLALTRIAWSVGQGIRDIDFNEEPFLLGAFDQIVSRPSSRVEQGGSFTIGAYSRLEGRRYGQSGVNIEGTFSRSDAQPKLNRWSVESDSYKAVVNYSEDGEYPKWHVVTPSGELRTSSRRWGFRGTDASFSLRTILRVALDEGRLGQRELFEGRSASIAQSDLEIFQRMIWSLRPRPGARPYAFAPIRTQPQRTYDPLRETPEPHGSHVPMILARMSSSNPEEWKNLKKVMQDFGKASGLFSGVDVRRMGKNEGDPFQVRVKIAGSAFNLVDVGYGVSQILPIIVDILRSQSRDGDMFLLQQPEVHLHPRAQAELGSFLAVLASRARKRFVVETHSDYLVDRIRMDIRDRKNIEPKDVMILYFERQNGKVKVHPIEIDENGNLESVPKGYRSFFLEEERRFLGG